MISSFDVYQMQTAQQQSFLVNQQMAYQSGNPYGMGAPQHNMPAYSAFSYQGSETGYGLGNKIGNSVVGAGQTAYQAGSLGVTAAGAYAGFKMGGASGAFRGAMMAGGPLLGAGMMAGGHVFGNMMEGAQDQQAMYGTLGRNFQFSGSNSRTGRGFSRQDAKSISDFVMQMQSVPELMSSMGELNNIMQKVSQMGIMNGIRNAQDFQKRFKETVNTLKDVSKIMETTMEDAVKFMEESRRSGMYTPSAIRQNALQRQFTAGVTGMNQDQIGNLQFAGSQIAFGYGGMRGSGAQSAMRSARQIGMANEMGLMSNDKIAELTGLEGAQGIQSMATSLTDAAQRMSVGGLGTAMSIALGKQSNGRFTGDLDEELVQKVRMGGISKQELLKLAHQKTASRTQKMSFKANEDHLRSEMASQVGAEGIAMELGDILGGAGHTNPDALNIVMKRFGVNERDAKMISEMGRNMPEIQRELGARGQTEGRRIAEQSYLKENMSNEAIKRKLFKKLENTFSEPFRHIGANISNAVGSYVDNFMDSLLDRYSTQVTKEMSSLTAGSLSGSAGSQAKMAAIIKDAGNVMGRGSVDIGLGEKAMDYVGIGGSRSERYGILKDLNSRGLSSYSEKGGYSERGGNLTIKGAGYSQSTEQMAATRRYFGDLQSGKLPGDLLAKIQKDDDLAATMGSTSKHIQDILSKNSYEMKEMSQQGRVNFIRDKLKSGWFSSRGDLISLEKQGVNIEEAISFAQLQGKMGGDIGSVNFNKLGSELLGTGDFGTAGDLEKNERSVRGLFAKQFGEQESHAEALLKTDSKSRDLLLKATNGDADAIRLLKKDLSTTEKEKLLAKFGISEGQLDQVQKVYAGAGGKNLSSFSSNMSSAINRSSVGGLAAQLRRQGIDIGGRLDKTHLSGNVKSSIGAFASTLSNLTDAKSLSDFLGGAGSKQIEALFGSIDKLKGKDREEALASLGEGATSAFGYGSGLHQAALQRGGLNKERLAGMDSDMQDWIHKRMSKDGRLSEKDASELEKMARNRYYGASLAAGGSVSKQDTSNKEFLENINKFAQTTSQFAQLVIQATPQLAENVKKAQQNVARDANITPVDKDYSE